MSRRRSVKASQQGLVLHTGIEQRWAAETAFGMLKSKGFDLETTHLRDPERILRLLSVLVIAMLWGLRVGEHPIMKRIETLAVFCLYMS